MKVLLALCPLLFSMSYILPVSEYSVAHAEEKRATLEDAKKMLDNAVSFIKTQGTEKGLAEFSSKTGKFIDRDLYIFVIDYNGLMLAHGTNEKLIGNVLLGIKDADGKLLIQEIISSVKTASSGAVSYKWAHPVSKKVEAKKTLVEKVTIGGKDYILSCGAYVTK